jgi:RNA polymerase II subunit A small phosphatase-like protein
MPQHLLVFDLDETLVRATTTRRPEQELAVFGDLYVYQRPHARELIQYASENFDLGVWSSASHGYVKTLASELFAEGTLKFVWAVERCIQRPNPQSGGYLYIKDLRKLRTLGYQVEEITMVDDSPEKVQRQPKNLLWVKPLLGEPSDTELLRVQRELESRFNKGAPAASAA